MNTRAFLAALRETMQRGGVENAAFEARTLLEIVLGKERATNAYISDAALSAQQTAQTEALLQRRLSGEPLQYLCGNWDFLDSTFAVGEGVLIPRPETEELVLLALERMKGMPAPTVFDLCAGSGCIGLSVKRRRSDANVYLFELSEGALRYCNENRCALGFARTVPLIQADVLRGYAAVSSLPVPDVILSNPPYIASAELPTLQREVQKEPAMALDGGEDGLVFYRAIAEKWLPFLRPGALVGVECGETQTQLVAALFGLQGFSCEISKDFNGFDRFVFARKGQRRPL
ncbi:MAG: peptide chain release factor N(5)-glutamine methyltransferase [Clostridia bacterium]|nr:peptide chain release factor N(5)-glutamine methyltransferase [Clostridia bacterium]